MPTLATATPSCVRASLAAAALALIVAAPSAQVPRSQLDELLFHANQYVVAYQQKFSGLVAEERYTQRIERSDGSAKRSRTLVSDYLLVALTGDSFWRGLRDVREVDGKPVRDREARVLDLFLKPRTDISRQINRLLDESARYNIGDIVRNFNQPVLPLVFLDPINQFRFTFSHDGAEPLEHGLGQILSFTEQVRPTLIQMRPTRRASAVDTYSRGRFWLDGETGRVLKSELLLGDQRTRVSAMVTVTYEPNAGLDIWVPAAMDERYVDPVDARGEVISGHAEYGNYRSFSVSTEMSIK